MPVKSYTINAGDTVQIPGGNFLRIIESVDEVTVKFYRGHQELSDERAEGVKAGYAGAPKPDLTRSEHAPAFDFAEVYSATTQTVKVLHTSGETRYDRSTGDVTATIAQGATITSGSSSVGAVDTELLAADANARAITIKNTHATQDLYITGGGEAADATKWKLAPGESYTFTASAKSAIRGYGSAAATTYQWIKEAS